MKIRKLIFEILLRVRENSRRRLLLEQMNRTGLEKKGKGRGGGIYLIELREN